MAEAMGASGGLIVLLVVLWTTREARKTRDLWALNAAETALAQYVPFLLFTGALLPLGLALGIVHGRFRAAAKGLAENAARPLAGYGPKGWRSPVEQAVGMGDGYPGETALSNGAERHVSRRRLIARTLIATAVAVAVIGFLSIHDYIAGVGVLWNVMHGEIRPVPDFCPAPGYTGPLEESEVAQIARLNPEHPWKVIGRRPRSLWAGLISGEFCGPVFWIAYRWVLSFGVLLAVAALILWPRAKT
jgi:hypothetical protein